MTRNLKSSEHWKNDKGGERIGSQEIKANGKKALKTSRNKKQKR